MKKIIVIIVVLFSLFGCNKKEKNPATFDKIFVCDGQKVEFRKDGTITLGTGANAYNGTYKKEGETAYHVYLDDGSGGFIKVDGDKAGVIVNSTTAKAVVEMDMSDTDITCVLQK